MTKTRTNADSANPNSIAGSRLENGSVLEGKIGNGVITNDKVSSDINSRIKSDRLNFIQLLRSFTNPPSDRTVQDKCREIYSVEDFGAIGNGVVDDTVAIQRALNNFAGAQERTRMLVFSSRKKYRVTAPLIINSLSNRFIIDGRGSEIICDHNGDCISYTAFNSSFGGHSYYNLTLTGPNDAGKFDPTKRPSTGAGFRLEKFYQGTISNCSVNGFNYGIRLVGGNGNVFTNNNQVYNNNYGIWFETTNGFSTNANVIENMYIRENWNAGVWFNDAGELSEIKGNRIDRCIIESNTAYPYPTPPGSPTNNTGVYLGPASYTYITNTYFESQDAAIYCYAASRESLYLTNCNFTRGGTGFPTDIRFKCVAGNQFRNIQISNTAFLQTGSDTSITFEDVSDFAGEIYISDSTGVSPNAAPSRLFLARCRQNSGFAGLIGASEFNEIPYFAPVSGLGTETATLNLPGYNLIFPVGSVPITGQRTIITNTSSPNLNNVGREITFFTSWSSSSPPPMYIGISNSLVRGLPNDAPFFWFLNSGDFLKFVGISTGGATGFWHALGHGVQLTSKDKHSNYRGQIVSGAVSRFAFDPVSNHGVTYSSTVSNNEIIVNDSGGVLSSSNANTFSVVTNQNGVTRTRKVTSVAGGGPAKNLQFTPALAAGEVIDGSAGFFLTVWVPLY
jgi:parallel beta-helix repeat protein